MVSSSNLKLAEHAARLLETDPHQAEKAFRALAEEDPDESYFAGAIASALLSQGKVVEAAPLLEDATTRWPAEGTLFSLLAEALLKLKATDRALQAAQRALALAKTDEERTLCQLVVNGLWPGLLATDDSGLVLRANFLSILVESPVNPEAMLEQYLLPVAGPLGAKLEEDHLGRVTFLVAPHAVRLCGWPGPFENDGLDWSEWPEGRAKSGLKLEISTTDGLPPSPQTLALGSSIAALLVSRFGVGVVDSLRNRVLRRDTWLATPWP